MTNEQALALLRPVCAPSQELQEALCVVEAAMRPYEPVDLDTEEDRLNAQALGSS